MEISASAKSAKKNSSMLRGSSATEVTPTASPKDNKAAPCFVFSFEEDEKHTQEKKRRGKLSVSVALWLCFINTHALFPKLPV
jgi:hypothetical protein